MNITPSYKLHIDSHKKKQKQKINLQHYKLKI